MQRRLDQLKNVGPIALKDFSMLGIFSVEQLIDCEPNKLYSKLRDITGVWHDPCVWDVFAAAIHEARTGERKNWWDFTPQRKLMQKQNIFPSDQS